MAGVNKGHLVDFLDDQLKTAPRALSAQAQRNLFALAQESPAAEHPVAERPAAEHPAQEYPASIRVAPAVEELFSCEVDVVSKVEPELYDVDPLHNLRLQSEPLQKLLTEFEEIVLTSDRPYQDQAQIHTQAQASPTPRSFDPNQLTLHDICSLDLTKLSGKGIKILAWAMKDVQIKLHSKHTEHGHVFNTTLLVALCCCMKGPQSHSSVKLGGLALFAKYDATRVISHLIQIAPGMFNIDQIGFFLRSMMLWTVSRKLETDQDIEDRLARESALSECGCLLVAAYLEYRIKENYTTNLSTAEMIGILNELKRIEDPGPLLNLQIAAQRAATSAHGVQRLSNIIFSNAILAGKPEPHGWFLGMTIEGAGQFADHAKEAKDKKIEHISTVLAFGFALSGFIPYAGPFMGIVGLTADKALNHFWKSDDFRPFIQKLGGLTEARIVLQGQRAIQGGNRDPLAVKQCCDDMINAKRRTQEMGAHVSFHEKAKAPVKGLLNRLTHRRKKIE